MGLMCFFKDHNWESTEVWTGTAYDIIRIEVEQFKCSRCGKTKKSVRVFGKLSKKVAEDIVESAFLSLSFTIAPILYAIFVITSFTDVICVKKDSPYFVMMEPAPPSFVQIDFIAAVKS